MHPGKFGPGPWNGGYYPGFFYYGARCRLFPRLFWFGLGAFAFAAWSRHEERQRRIADGPYTGSHNEEWRHWSGSRFGCQRRREREQQQLQQQQQQWNAGASSQAGQATQPIAIPTVVPAAAPTPAPTPVPSQSPAPAYPVNTSPVGSGEWHTERIREVGKQASETMAEMSENALDALMANLQSLKAKIVEAREAREKAEGERLYAEQRIPSDKADKNDHPERLV